MLKAPVWSINRIQLTSKHTALLMSDTNTFTKYICSSGIKLTPHFMDCSCGSFLSEGFVGCESTVNKWSFISKKSTFNFYFSDGAALTFWDLNVCLCQDVFIVFFHYSWHLPLVNNVALLCRSIWRMAPCSRNSSSTRGQPNQKVVSSSSPVPHKASLQVTGVCLTDEVAAETQALLPAAQ